MKVRSGAGLVVGSAIGAGGAAIVAVAGTLCCAGPAVVAVLGASGALTAARLEPFRPYLLTVAIVFLALGFWRSYAPRSTVVAGQVCKVRTGRTVRVVLWLSAIVTVASILAPWVLS